jgi:hypothetical protein
VSGGGETYVIIAAKVDTERALFDGRADGMRRLQNAGGRADEKELDTLAAIPAVAASAEIETMSLL